MCHIGISNCIYVMDYSSFEVHIIIITNLRIRNNLVILMKRVNFIRICRKLNNPINMKIDV